jgi:hypothetical protein
MPTNASLGKISAPVSLIDYNTGNELSITSSGYLTANITTAADKSGSGTITALNGTVAVTTNGCSTVVFNITGTWVATVTVQATVDGINWFNTFFNLPSTGETVFYQVGNNNTLIVNCGGYQQVRLIAIAFTSGTVNVAYNAGAGLQDLQVRSYNAADFNATVTPIALTKGTQGTTGFSVQNLKDAGRTYVTFTADTVAGVTSETLMSMTQNKQGSITASQTNYTITSGKTLRIQSITIAVQAGTGAGEWVRVKIRHNTAGATTTSSALVYTVGCGNTAATTATSGEISVPIPDGLEIFGNGTQTIGITHISSATTNVESVTVCGYEY